MEKDPVSEILYSLEYQAVDKVQNLSNTKSQLDSLCDFPVAEILVFKEGPVNVFDHLYNKLVPN
jgi:hypothetical protein